MKNFKTFAILASLTFTATLAFAGNSPICKPTLVKMLGDKLQEDLTSHDTQKAHLVGKITQTNIKSDWTKVKVGEPCEMTLSLYSPADKNVTTVTVDFKAAEFNPFNHSVATTNSCGKTDDNKVEGTSFRQENSGWHNAYGTTVKVSKNEAGLFTINYSVYDCDGGFASGLFGCHGGVTHEVTCQGQLQ